MRLKHLKGNEYIDLDTAEIIQGDPRDLNICVEFLEDTIIHFGKYRGKTMKQIALENYSYIQWMKSEGFDVKVEQPRTPKGHKKSRKEKRGSLSATDLVLLKKLKNDLDRKMYNKHPAILDDKLCGDYYDPEDHDDCPF
jgi:hypothetical protein